MWKKTKVRGDQEEYKKLHTNVRRRITKAKRSWIETKYKEAQKMLEHHNSFRFHKKMKQLTGTLQKAFFRFYTHQKEKL